jgi:hypothetical protein
MIGVAFPRGGFCEVSEATSRACIRYTVVDLPVNPFLGIIAMTGSGCEWICSLRLWDKWCTRVSSPLAAPCRRVKNVPVSYGIRFSVPMTALTARHVWYGVGARLHLPVRPSSRLYSRSSPTAFSISSLHPFSSLFILAMSRASGLWRAPLPLHALSLHRKIRRGL